MRSAIHNILLKTFGLILLTAAVLEGHERLTTPLANADIWTNRNFIIVQVESELALRNGFYRKCFSSMESCRDLYASSIQTIKHLGKEVMPIEYEENGERIVKRMKMLTRKES